MTTEELKVIISAETAKYDKAIKKVTQSTNKLQKTLSRAFGFTALAAFSKSCLQAASDLEEVQNVVDVSFGEMSDSANEFAKNAIASFGITELQAKQLSSTFMAMSNSIGLMPTNARDMSLSLTALAADMSSFYNVTLEAAQSALEGIFTGQTRALRQYGVVIDEATLSEYALSQGIQKSVSSMTNAEKVTLRYNYVMHALSNVIGDYTRTSGSWANQIRLLVNQFNQLRVALGVILQGILGPILIRLNQILARIVQIAQAAAQAFGKKSEMSNAVSGVENFNAGLGDAYVTANKLKKTLSGFDELNTLTPKTEDANISGGGIGSLDMNIPNLDDYMSKIEKATSETNGMQESLKSIKTILLILAGITAFKWLNELIQGIPLVQKLTKTAYEGINVWSLAGRTVEHATGKFSAWLLVLRSLPGAIANQLRLAKIASSKESLNIAALLGNENVGGVIASTVGKIALIGAAVVTVGLRFKELWQTNDEFKERVINAWESIKNGLGALVKAFAPLWECLKMLADTIKNVWQQTIKPTVDAISDLVIATILNVMEMVGSLMSGPLSGLISIVVNIASVVLDAINSIFNLLSPYFTAFTGVMIPLLIKGIEGILHIVLQVVNGVINAVGGVVNFIGTAFGKIHDFVHNLAEGFTNGFWNIVNGIRGFVNNMIYYIESAINGIVSSFNNSGVIRGINRILGTNIQLGYVYIPRLANGGVVNTPTMAQIGEYPGASTNPEIVAPQSILKETIDASNSELASAFVQMTQQIISAINNKDLEIQIGDTTIAKSAARGNRSYQLATGQSLF